jgi:hypothetical protein
MQGIMLYFSGSGVQIFSLGIIFMLLTSPISAVLSIFKGTLTCPLYALWGDLWCNVAFEAFRPTPPTGQIGEDGKETVAPPSYLPLIPQMLAYVACQGLV